LPSIPNRKLSKDDYIGRSFNSVDHNLEHNISSSAIW